MRFWNVAEADTPRHEPTRHEPPRHDPGLSKEMVDHLQIISELITSTSTGSNGCNHTNSVDIFDLPDDECPSHNNHNHNYAHGKPPMKIRPFSDIYTSVHLVNWLEQSCETIAMQNYGPTRQLYLTASDDYTHAIIFGYAMPLLAPDITPEKVIGMAHCSVYEAAPPAAFIKYAQKHIGLYFVGEHLGKNKPFVRHVCHPLLTLSTTYLMDQKFPFAKTRLLSIHVSATSFQKKTPGALYCKLLVRRILTTNLPIDIYGTGTIPDDLYEDSHSRTDVRIRGPVADMAAMLDPYIYHIFIESCVSPCYYSGGPINALLRRANVLYFGSTALVEQYHSGITHLTGNLDEDMKLLHNIAAEPLRYYIPIDSEYIKYIKNTENLVKHLPQYFHDAIKPLH